MGEFQGEQTFDGPGMKDFRDLKVWRKAHSLTLAIYKATELFPRHERYGLTSQMRRCAASIPSNIAEGCGRGSDPELARYLRMSLGSASELEYQTLLATDLGYLGPEEYSRFDVDINEVKKMLVALIQKLDADARGDRQGPAFDR
jgi:four helix bundle protein